MKTSLLLFFPRRTPSFVSPVISPDSPRVCLPSFPSFFSFIRSSFSPKFSFSPSSYNPSLPHVVYTQQLMVYNESLPSDYIEGRIIKHFFVEFDSVDLSKIRSLIYSALLKLTKKWLVPSVN